MGTLVEIVRGAAFLGAVISLVAVNALEKHVVLVVTVVSAVTGMIVLADLVFGVDRRARTHDELFRRCKELQAKIMVGDGPLPVLKAEAQRIWRDEPPILWAIYAKSWNQIAARHEADVDAKRATWGGRLRGWSPRWAS